VQAVVVDAPAHTPRIPVPPSKPLVVLDGLSAPLLLMHGTADGVIPVSQSREYESAARAQGKPITVEYFDGAGHMVSIVSESRQKARADAIGFLRTNLSK
jgi:dipeptidyl aminopeptidase/acylaminoacyl peptidase